MKKTNINPKEIVFKNISEQGIKKLHNIVAEKVTRDNKIILNEFSAVYEDFIEKIGITMNKIIKQLKSKKIKTTTRLYEIDNKELKDIDIFKLNCYCTNIKKISRYQAYIFENSGRNYIFLEESYQFFEIK